MITVAALYHFIRFADPAALRGPLQELCAEHGVKGSLLLASEGVNGTIAGPAAGIEVVLAHLRALPGCAGLEHKLSYAEELPFGRMKVKLKREIVTMGQPDVDPIARVGSYVAPEDWNALIDQPDVVLIDTRNDYEVGIGSFDGAVDPDIRSFREFPKWWEDHRDDFRGKRVAMFCWRDPLREIDKFPARAGCERGLSPEGRHPEIPGRGVGRDLEMERRVLCLRRPRLGRAWACAGRL
jgi:UPF0176 protein